MLKSCLTILVLLVSFSALAKMAHPLTFYGDKIIKEIQTGKMTTTVRLNDRTKGKNPYSVGDVLAITNTESKEKLRDQAMKGTYRYIQITKLEVKKLATLPQKVQQEFRAMTPADQIEAADGIVTVFEFKYKENP